MKYFSDNQGGLFLTIAERIAPGIDDLDVSGRAEFLHLIDNAFAPREPGVRRQFQLFLFLLRWLPFLRFGAPLDRLAEQKQIRVLRWFEGKAFVLLRKGFWGLKTLVYLGYYGQAAVSRKMHYTPCVQGNEKLHA